ncbi:MAG: hypothetical protein HQ491_11670 [Bacteroidetes bacterium]|nr:hypothetical protein [Bacteroidota bacterium]
MERQVNVKQNRPMLAVIAKKSWAITACDSLKLEILLSVHIKAYSKLPCQRIVPASLTAGRVFPKANFRRMTWYQIDL